MKRFINRLWASPTFTTWGSQGIQAFRLLAVTPLILTQFDTNEIAAWFLFGSLMLFGSLLRARISLTFSRMIAFAMGGAEDLSPIKDKKSQRGNGEPNWPTVERTYGTIGIINALLTILASLVALGLGFYGLEKIGEGSDQPFNLWSAFGIMLGTQAIVFFFDRYAIALRGMNYIALINRWNIVFSLLSVLAGFIVLSRGANIWQLALTMQSIELLNIIRMRYLLRWVEQGRFRLLSAYRFDRQILGWAWEPVWKGFIVTMSYSGMMSLAQIIFARHMPVEATASFLFTMRILSTISATADAPFMSHLPRMSRFMAERNTRNLRIITVSKIALSQWLLVGGLLALAILGNPVLSLIQANTSFLTLPVLLTFSGSYLLHNYWKLNIVFSAAGNHIVCFNRELISAVLSVILLIVLVPEIGVWGALIGLFVPHIFILNWQPMEIASGKIELPLWKFVRDTTGLSFCVFLVSYLFLLFI